jgi:hypothetical protein
MKKSILFALILFSLKICGQTPMWIKIIESTDPDSVTSSAPYTETELINLFRPSNIDNLIGTEINISTSLNVLLDFHNLNALLEVLFVNPIYRSQTNNLLSLNQGSPQTLLVPNQFKYTIGHTSGSNTVEIPFIHILEWKNPETKIKKGATINILVKHFYSNPFLIPEVQIESANEIPLRKGAVHFVRLGPGDQRKYETSFYIENGEVINPIALSAGHYEVELIQPEECSGILNENLVILPDDLGNNEKFKFIKSCEKTYDIYATYHAPGFAHAELVWQKAKIRFPDEGDEMQFFDRTAYIQCGGHGENPTGTDGKPLDIPFAMDVPGIGKITNYGAPENNIPRVISIHSLGAYQGQARFKIQKTEEALNMCEMTQKGDGSVYLDLSFDLFAGGSSSNTDWVQHTVSCVEDGIISNRDKVSIINRSPYPTAFGQITISEVDIENFKGFEEFEKTISNGRATLKIEFKISEEINH